MPPFNLNYENQFRPFECCKPRYATGTATNGFKWSKKEIEAEILYTAGKLANSKWYERGDLRRRLKGTIYNITLGRKSIVFSF